MKKTLSMLLALLFTLSCLTACGGQSEITMGEKTPALSVEEARKELNSLLTKVRSNEITDPMLDIYGDVISEAAALASIDTFRIAEQGRGQVNIEIAAATELSSESPDDWLVAVARNFNRENNQINGRSVSVTVRTITSGEILTYIKSGGYQPNMAVFSNDAWGRMAEASGIGIECIEDRIAGNTAGILLSKQSDEKIRSQYGETNFKTVIQAAQDGTIIFGYPNPYTSSTGLNGLAEMLGIFDPDDPLSAKASQALAEYQKTAPPVAYTTAVLRNQAKKGIIDAMLMEEQAYANTPELSDYIYIPFGIRHDHPVYVFDWNTAEQDEAARLFADYCLNAQNQKLAGEKGFNRHEDYAGTKGLTGQQYLTAQSLWKQNKNGGRPVAAVFVTDISGSMAGEPIASLKNSVIATLPYIGSENYVGLISYNSDVTVNLSMLEEDAGDNTVNVKPFDDRQRAYFSGEIKNLQAAGGTATYDAVLTALDMINKAQSVVPGDLDKLSAINEASTVKADTDNVVNQLRNLFNTQL